MATVTAMPNFLCVGAAKAGTTTLYYLLKQHPEVFLTTPKELNFFSLDERYRRGWEWYLAHFQAVGPQHKAIGEFGVTYTVVRWTQTIPRMKALLPELKIVYMVRDPIARMESQWIENRLGRNRRRISFADSVRRPETIENNRYWNRYQDYVDAYGADHVHIIFLERFRDQTATEMKRLFTFLGVDPEFEIPHIHSRYNQSSDKREDGAALDWGRRIPGFNFVRSLIPVSLRDSMRQWLKRSAPVEKPIWNRADYEWVCKQLRADSHRLLRHCGMPDDLWSFQTTHPITEESAT